MEVSKDDITIGGIVVGWIGTVLVAVWKFRGFYQDVQEVKKDVADIRSGGLMTHVDHEKIQKLCRLDVDNELKNNREMVDRLCRVLEKHYTVMERHTDDISEIKKNVAVIMANCIPQRHEQQ